jgi:hypothetical protein
MGDLHLVTPVDIIYIMDLSRSMITTFVPSGDPYRKRDDALRAGFQYQIDSLQESHAGYVGFGSTIPADHLLAPVNVITGQTQLMDMADHLQTYVDNDQHASGTQYNIALDQAITWLDDTVYCPHDIKAIIFISDGEPSDGYNYTPAQLQYLQDDSIAVHGIFLGDNMGVALQTLATETGGTSTLVPPINNDTLATVVKNIVRTYIDEIVAEEVTLINATTVDTATSVAEYEVSDTVWSVKMDNYVPLKPGLNEVTVNSTFRSVGGYDTTLEFTFYLDLQDTVDYTSECYSCWTRTRLEVEYFPPSVRFDDTLPYSPRAYILRLFYYDTDTIDKPEIDVSTEFSNDQETVILNNRQWSGIECLFIDTASLDISSEPAIADNDTTEPFYDDTIYFAWYHHKDFLDTLEHATLTIIPYLRTVRIYDTLGDPASLTPYNSSPDSTIVNAGDTVDLYAKVFAGALWLDQYENDPLFSNQITWSFVDAETGLEDTAIGKLLSDSCNDNLFYCKKARKSVDITATLKIPGLPDANSTIRLVILPGSADQLVIEATKDSTLADLYNPDPYDPIEMYSNETTKTAYAILRDNEGNWIGPAADASWTSDSTAVVTVSAGPSEKVTITKGTANAGQTNINAQQDIGGTLLTGSSTVTILTYGIDSLRIVTSVNSAYEDIIQLQMETSVDTMLYVLGRRTDNNDWALIKANWYIDPDVTQDNPPENSDHWLVKPDGSSAMGEIFVTYSSGTSALSDTVHFEFGTMPVINYLSLKKQNIKIYPIKKIRGASIRIHLSNHIESIEVSLITINGRTIASCNGVNTKYLSLEIGNVSNGIYFLQLKSNNQSLVKKVLFKY